MTSGFATGFNVPPACPARPPLLPGLPRVLPAMRGGFFKPSLDGGLLLFELFLSVRRRRSATSWRNAAFSARKTSISRCSASTRPRISGRRIIHTLNSRFPTARPENSRVFSTFSKTVANRTSPQLGSYCRFFFLPRFSRLGAAARPSHRRPIKHACLVKRTADRRHLLTERKHHRHRFG